MISALVISYELFRLLGEFLLVGTWFRAWSGSAVAAVNINNNGNSNNNNASNSYCVCPGSSPSQTK